MALWQNYLRPKTLSEVLNAFANAPRPLAPIAGGTDLILDLEQGRHPPVATLIDVTSVVEMNVLEIRGEALFIGASVPVNRIVRDPLALRHAAALTEACNQIAGPQVRNVATLGGNVAHALPAADGSIALLALGAEAEITSTTGRRTIALPDLFLGPGKSSLKHGEELIIGFLLPVHASRMSGSSFRRIMRPQGVALPILNCAVWLECAKGSIRDIRIAVGPGGAIPFRATQAEDVLRGQTLDETIQNSSIEALLEQVRFRTSHRRASADYRRHLVDGLLRETLNAAWKSANLEIRDV